MGEDAINSFIQVPCKHIWANKEIRHQLWGNPSPTFRKSVPVLGKDWLDLGENLLGFWIGLGESASFTVLNAKHVWGWVLLKVSQPLGSWKGRILKPINFDIETVLGFVLGTCVRCHKHKLIHSCY